MGKLRKLLNYFKPEKKVENVFTDQKKLDMMQFVRENLWLKELNITKIIDVGANEGQAAERFRALLPNAEIISFEPIPTVYSVLLSNFSDDQNFTAHNFALGNKIETTELFLNEYSPSSSLLKMADEHKKHFAHAQKETKQKINIKTLDSINDLIDEKDTVLLKLDVQGFEKNVIVGGKESLKKIKVIIAELSLKTLYDGEPLFDDVYQLLKEQNFKYIGSFDQLKAPVNNEILQQDAIFINQKI